MLFAFYIRHHSSHNAIHIIHLTPQPYSPRLPQLYIRYHNILTTTLLALYIRYHRSTISAPLKLYITITLFTLYIRHHCSHSGIRIYTQHQRLAHYDASHIIHQIPQYPHHKATQIINQIPQNHSLKAIHTYI